MNAVVSYTREGPVAWVTLNRPEARNALNQAVRDGVRDGFARFQQDDGAVCVLAAAGDDFCSGGDLKEMADTSMAIPPADFIVHLGRTMQVTKPVIAAVQGRAFGGGFLLAQMCDLCICAQDAQLGITEARWGRGAPWAAPLPWLIAPRVALELLMTADPIDAARGYELGLVNRVVPTVELHATAQALAERIAANAPLSVAAGKALVYGVAGRPWLDGLQLGDELYAPVYTSEDAQEGPRAFREKRRPSWKGR